jgi:hypothetical protein
MFHKMKITVEGVYTAAVKDLDKQVVKSPNKFSKSNDESDPQFSPYAISIQCPPAMLNTIQFSNIGGK